MDHKFYLVSALILLASVNSSTAALDTERLLEFALSQYNRLSSQLDSTDFIHTGQPGSSSWGTTGLSSWTVGFYPGSLWHLYQLTNDTKWSQLALAHSAAVKARQYDTSTHDVGFVIHATYVNALLWLDMNSDEFKGVIVNASTSLSTRFHELSGCIRSWNNDPGHGGEPGEVKVIADNMMNLELLFWGSIISQNQTYRNIAISHANKTLEEHIRPDDSSFHAVAYNETTGLVRRKYTWQGYANDSTWARGQAWIIHGFTTVFANTGDPRFLATAEAAASFYIAHLPEDYVPFWDFDVAELPGYQPRDTSAASIVASALIQLYGITSNTTYLEVAERTMESLSSPKYRADGQGEYQIPAILVNGTVFYNENNLNTAIVYADYYYLQALYRYRLYVGV